MAVIPVGGDYIPYDLAVGLKTTLEQSEMLTITNGVSLLNHAVTEESIKVNNVTGKGTG